MFYLFMSCCVILFFVFLFPCFYLSCLFIVLSYFYHYIIFIFVFYYYYYYFCLCFVVCLFISGPIRPNSAQDRPRQARPAVPLARMPIFQYPFSSPAWAPLTGLLLLQSHEAQHARPTAGCSCPGLFSFPSRVWPARHLAHSFPSLLERPGLHFFSLLARHWSLLWPAGFFARWSPPDPRHLLPSSFLLAVPSLGDFFLLQSSARWFLFFFKAVPGHLLC